MYESLLFVGLLIFHLLYHLLLHSPLSHPLMPPLPLSLPLPFPLPYLFFSLFLALFFSLCLIFFAPYLGSGPKGVDDLCFYTYGKFSPPPSPSFRTPLPPASGPISQPGGPYPSLEAQIPV